MRRRLTLNSSVPLVLAMLVVALGAIAGQRLIAGRAFGSLEASTVAPIRRHDRRECAAR